MNHVFGATLMALTMAPVRSLLLGPGPPGAPRSFELDAEQHHDMRRSLRQDAVLADDDAVVYLRGGEIPYHFKVFWSAFVTLLITTGKGVLADCKIVTRPDLDASMLVTVHMISNVSHRIGGLDARLKGLDARFEGRFKGVEGRLTGVEGRLEGVEG